MGFNRDKNGGLFLGGIVLDLVVKLLRGYFKIAFPLDF